MLQRGYATSVVHEVAATISKACIPKASSYHFSGDRQVFNIVANLHTSLRMIHKCPSGAVTGAEMRKPKTSTEASKKSGIVVCVHTRAATGISKRTAHLVALSFKNVCSPPSILAFAIFTISPTTKTCAIQLISPTTLIWGPRNERLQRGSLTFPGGSVWEVGSDVCDGRERTAIATPWRIRNRNFVAVHKRSSHQLRALKHLTWRTCLVTPAWMVGGMTSTLYVRNFGLKRE